MSPPANDRTPLLNGGDVHSNLPFAHRVLHTIKGDGQPSWANSYKHFLFGSWFNIFLLFIPFSFISHWSNWDAALRFSFSFLAIMPLAKLLGVATDQLSLPLGQTLSGLLNASFGNAVEIIVGVAALLQGQLRIVQTSMLGSILSNLLLVMGSSFIAGGMNYTESKFQVTGAQTASSLMTLACITLVIPAAYHSSKAHAQAPFPDETINNLFNAVINNPAGDPPAPNDGSKEGLLMISRGTAILLLVVYVIYLIFQLKTHPEFFNDDDPVEEEETQLMNTAAAGTALLLVTIITAFCADYLVASIEETAHRYHIPKAFIGIVLLPIVANAAEHVTSVWMAYKGKTELTIGICVGSSIQIATFVIPLLVVIGWIAHHDLTLFFADFETIVLFVSVLLVNLLIMDGKSNYMEGVMLIALYIVIALAFWVS